MVRLSAYAEEERHHLRSLPCPRFAQTPFITGIVLKRTRVAVISTAGLHHRNDAPFGIGDTGYRIIATDIDANDLVMSHISTNFDRTGFQMDLNMVLPLDRLKELVHTGTIASIADYHYSFMGATDPTMMERHARDVAILLKRDRVSAVLLVPV